MTPPYFLWHTQRQGWVGHTGTTTDIGQAKSFNRDEALAYVKRNLDHNNIPVVLPVNSSDLP